MGRGGQSGPWDRLAVISGRRRGDRRDRRLVDPWPNIEHQSSTRVIVGFGLVGGGVTPLVAIPYLRLGCMKLKIGMQAEHYMTVEMTTKTQFG